MTIREFGVKIAADATAGANDKNMAIRQLARMIEQYIAILPTGTDIPAGDGKTLTGCLKTLEDEARRMKVGSCGVVGPDRALELAAAYYGLPAMAVNPSATPAAPATAVAPEKKLDIDLADLL